MVTREYECPQDGYFKVLRSISAPVVERCPNCNEIATQIFTKFPTWGILGDGIPNNAKDTNEYDQWQRDRWARYEDKCNVENMGTDYVDPAKIVPKHTFGKDD